MFKEAETKITQYQVRSGPSQTGNNGMFNMYYFINIS